MDKVDAAQSKLNTETTEWRKSRAWKWVKLGLKVLILAACAPKRNVINEHAVQLRERLPNGNERLLKNREI